MDIGLMLKKLDGMEAHYHALTERLGDPDLIRDQAAYRAVAKERSDLESLIAGYAMYKETLKHIDEARELVRHPDSDLAAMAHEELERNEASRVRLEEELAVKLLPKDPHADKNIIIEIRGGAGGEEAALFAAELYRMYTKYAERRGWKSEVLALNATELGGIKEVTFSIMGLNAYSHLKFESGVHRVQRVPATESSGRVHTSTVTVAVLPEVEETEVEVKPDDLKIDVYRASGAGGQHVNKTESAVRITHLATGLVVACQDERSQRQNREKAMRVLRAKLSEFYRTKQEQEHAAARKSQVGTGDRSEKIRTYNFPQSRITDHRIGLSVHNVDQVMLGDLDAMVDALMMAEQQELLSAVS